jgi:hypothetical protein
MGAILEIDIRTAQARQFLKFARTLPFTTVLEPPKKSFEEAIAECNGITVDAFFDELDNRIKKRFDA